MTGVITASGLAALASHADEEFEAYKWLMERDFPPAIKPGWSIEREFAVRDLPSISPQWKHYRAAWKHVYPLPLVLARYFSDGYDERADNIGMKLHHWMGRHVPGYWNMFYYREKHGGQTTTVKLRFHKQDEIVLYGTSRCCKTVRRDGPVLSRIYRSGVEEILLYHSPVSNEICYPEHRHRQQVAFRSVPSYITARAIVDVFAMVAAVRDA